MATKTVSTGWSDGTSNFGSIFSDDGGDKYYSMPISTVNTAISGAGIPANAVISGVSLTATATIENSMAGRFYFSIGFGGSGSISTTLLNGAQIAYDRMSGSTTQTVSLNAALSNNSINTSKGSYITFRIYSTTWGKKTYKVKDVNLTITYSIPTYTLTVTAGAGGTVTGGGTYNPGTTVTLTATPNSGYKFIKWSDGNTSVTRSVTVTGNTTYTAYFEPIYILYDSIFSFKRWANNNLTSWDLITISNVTDTGFTGTAKVDDAYTTECRPLIPVEIGKTYTFECVTSGGGFEFFVFNCDSSGAWSDFTYGNTQKFNFTPSKSYISIRCDVVGTGTVVNFSNFRIYPADCSYMSSSVSATERTDVSSWSMPTPTREGYTFKGWNTKPDGSGTTYTSGSAFPTSSLVLYSQWERSGTYYVLFSGYGATSGANSAPSAITATYGQSYTLPSPNLNNFYKIANITWNGNADNAQLSYTEKTSRCTFVGWKRDPNSNTMYQPGESVNIEPTTEGGNVTFYATWQPATFEHPSATREGYKLKEWNTKADGSGTVYTGDTVDTLEDVTLYAQWVKAEPVFTSITITRSTDLAKVTINTPVDAGAKYIISVEVT